jgi:hypothetical protein
LLWVGPGRRWQGVDRWGGERWGRRRALDSTGLNDAVATQDTIPELAECMLRQADRYRPREFGYTSRTALLTKRRAVRSSNHLVTRRA